MNTQKIESKVNAKVKNQKPVNPNTIGGRIRSLRNAAGLTQLELALELQDCGVSVGDKSISKYETGTTPISVEALMWLCDILDTSSDYILFGSEPTISNIPAVLEDSIVALAEQIKTCRAGK